MELKTRTQASINQAGGWQYQYYLHIKNSEGKYQPAKLLTLYEVEEAMTCLLLKQDFNSYNDFKVFEKVIVNGQYSSIMSGYLPDASTATSILLASLACDNHIPVRYSLSIRGLVPIISSKNDEEIWSQLYSSTGYGQYWEGVSIGKFRTSPIAKQIKEVTNGYGVVKLYEVLSKFAETSKEHLF